MHDVSDLTANPSCNLAWDAPTTELGRVGITGGVRAPGDPSNVAISLQAIEFAGSQVFLVNRHLPTGREERSPVTLNENGSWETTVGTPIPSDWPLGEWQVIVEWPDGTTMDCGGFIIQAERTQKDPPKTGVSGILAGISNNMFIIFGALGFGALILFGGKKGGK